MGAPASRISPDQEIDVLFAQWEEAVEALRTLTERAQFNMSATQEELDHAIGAIARFDAMQDAMDLGDQA
ncbi:hypothetical protein RGI145_12425 [Roseomonas gilardii]|uniref:Uncharacterized protein n=1 Tax=Roseomonas gilardii TaxID=257708 RepID=A0A1L7AG83_9PROT|nr:hypothetical protein [Roseomonas gilardii]APT57798.1 hypothetical protein RGI145_12425 [Roseomonas gilardii]